MSYQAQKSLTSAPMIPFKLHRSGLIASNEVSPRRQIITQMKKLNQQMNTTLARTDLNPDIQATLYNQKSQRFLAMKQQQQDQFLPPLPEAFPSTHESEPELPYIDLSIPETDKEQEAQEEKEEIAPSTSIFHFQTPTTVDFEYQTPSPSLQKTLPYPPKPLTRKDGQLRKLIDLPEYGSSQYHKLGRWDDVSCYEVRMARRAMPRAIKAADKAKTFAVRNFFHKYEDVKDEH